MHKITEPKDKQNLTVSLDRETIRKARVIAAKRGTSISGLVAKQIEELVGKAEAYERAKERALALLEKGFNLGWTPPLSRDELHER